MSVTTHPAFFKRSKLGSISVSGLSHFRFFAYLFYLHSKLNFSHLLSQRIRSPFMFISSPVHLCWSSPLLLSPPGVYSSIITTLSCTFVLYLSICFFFAGCKHVLVYSVFTQNSSLDLYLLKLGKKKECGFAIDDRKGVIFREWNNEKTHIGWPISFLEERWGNVLSGGRM